MNNRHLILSLAAFATVAIAAPAIGGAGPTAQTALSKQQTKKLAKRIAKKLDKKAIKSIPAGPQGQPGPKGDSGPKGDTGEPGAPGDAGQDGVGALLGRINDLSATAATEHGSPNGTSSAEPAQADVNMISTSSSMTLRELRVFLPGGLPGGTTRTFTVATGIGDTAITCQVANPNFGCSDLVNSATVQFGTSFSIKVVTTGSPPAQDALFSLRALSG